MTYRNRLNPFGRDEDFTTDRVAQDKLERKFDA
jgi:hypothetical protein